MKKQTSSSKKTNKATLADGTVIAVTKSRRKEVMDGKIFKHDVPKEKFSTETGKDEADWEVNDDLDSHEYPPPSRHPDFRKFWAESIENITGRDNFQYSHLALFEAYCRLRVELRSLDTFLSKNGHTYRVTTVMGEMRKTYPEISERMKVLGQIATYARLLDLAPKKDKARGSATKNQEDEWA